jgi:hypothetical protein
LTLPDGLVDSLDRFLQLLVIVQPTAHLLDALAANTELARASSRIQGAIEHFEPAGERLIATDRHYQ